MLMGHRRLCQEWQEKCLLINLVDLVDDEDSAPTPPSVNKKRGAARIACSPGKKKKNPMQQDFKRYVDHCINEDRAISSSTQVVEEIEAIMK